MLEAVVDDPQVQARPNRAAREISAALRVKLSSRGLDGWAGRAGASSWFRCRPLIQAGAGLARVHRTAAPIGRHLLRRSLVMKYGLIITQRWRWQVEPEGARSNWIYL